MADTPLAPCPKCGAPCTTKVEMRGGDHGWGTTDAERTTYRYATEAAAMAATVPADAWMYDRAGSELNPHLMLAGKNADELRLGSAVLSACPNHINWRPLYFRPQAPVAGQPANEDQKYWFRKGFEWAETMGKPAPKGDSNG